MIDLHTHTTASDGTDSPGELVEAACRAGLEALAITDHDTFAGTDEAAPLAAAAGLRLVCGLELSTRILEETEPAARNAHMLAYFPNGAADGFREWLGTLRAARRARNERLSAKLQALGMDVTVEEAEAYGRNITGRPHFARVMREKGYVSNWEEAFRRYLGESGAAYVEREDPGAAEGIRRIHEAGGIASLAHIYRSDKRNAEEEEALLRRLLDAGLRALEVWHSDHDAAHTRRYLEYTRRYGLLPTGGSDYHGANKREIRLGCGRSGPLEVPLSALDDLCAAAARR
jgi:3',5'-nucleoside bisphosphate phosphatase